MLVYKGVWTSENHLNYSDFGAIICNMRGNDKMISEVRSLSAPKLSDYKASFVWIFRIIPKSVFVKHVEPDRISKHLMLLSSFSLLQI